MKFQVSMKPEFAVVIVVENEFQDSLEYLKKKSGDIYLM